MILVCDSSPVVSSLSPTAVVTSPLHSLTQQRGFLSVIASEQQLRIMRRATSRLSLSCRPEKMFGLGAFWQTTDIYLFCLFKIVHLTVHRH
jgi:hypothetical protein